MMTDQALIAAAAKVTVPRKLSRMGNQAGTVGCALLTDKGNVYTGICLDTLCGLGFCAEVNAIGTMLTHGEKNIVRMVAVNEEGRIYSPCGRCRELLMHVSDENAQTVVLLEGNKSMPLKDLLPEHWYV